MTKIVCANEDCSNVVEQELIFCNQCMEGFIMFFVKEFKRINKKTKIIKIFHK